MFMGPNNPGFGSRKRRTGLTCPDYRREFEFLKLKADSRSLLRGSATKSSARSKTEGANDFQALLSDSNREFTRLLRDVRIKTSGGQIEDSPNQRTNELLMRAMRCAAKQYMLQAELGNLALTDELTGLYNRRGFMALGERQLKLASRSGRGLLVIFVDVDGLKRINDSLGHHEGDRVLKRTAEALENTFRNSDVIARMGGDEFAVLAIEASKQSESTIKTRLDECLKSMAASESRYTLSLSLGISRFDSSKRCSMVDLMAQADRAMYEQKRRRSTLQGDTAPAHKMFKLGALLDHRRASP
jgi:diguanylate cyclase (GGDEF)-like protein